MSAPERSYRDDNHKPELVYALSRLDAMVGFRAPRRAAELLADLDTPLAADLHALLAADPTSAGVRTAFEWLLRPETRPGAADVAKFAEACARRLADGSPSPRTDRTVMRLAAAYPGDPGAVDVRPAQPGDPAAGERRCSSPPGPCTPTCRGSASRSWRTRTTCCGPA